MYNTITSRIFPLLPRICASKTSGRYLQCTLPGILNCAPILQGAENTLQVRYRSNRSRRGLYDGKDVRSGNNVSFSNNKTKRKFKPNVFLKRVYSEILDAMIPFHLTTSALRSIDKAGGLDNYLMKNEFTEGEGFKIKKCILKRLKNQAYHANKAAKLNNPVTVDMGDGSEGNEATKVEKMEG